MSVGYKTFGFCNGLRDLVVSTGKTRRTIPQQPCHRDMGHEIPHNELSQMPGLAENMRSNAARDGWTRDGDRDYCPECSKRRRDAAE